MFKYTKAMLSRIVEDFKRYRRIFNNASLVLTSIYFIYALVKKTGNFYANIVLAVLFVAYTIFEIATRGKGMKKARKSVKKGYKWMKLGIRALTLGAMLYGIYTATTNITPISIILTTLMIILWILQFLLAIACEVIESKINMLVAAVKEDFKGPKIFGRKSDEEDKPYEIVILDEQIEKEEAQRKEQEQRAREERKREKKAQRESKKQARHNKSKAKTH